MRKKEVPWSILLIIIIALISLFFILKPGMIGFATYESQPDATAGKDTYIKQTSDTNYGTTTTFLVGKVATAGGLDTRGLIQFDISSIPVGNTITNAVLSLYLSVSSNNSNITIKAYQLTSEWEETAASWNNATGSDLWTTAGGDYSELADSLNFTNQTGWYNFTITNLVTGWYNGTYDNYGLILISTDALSGSYKEIASSDNADSSIRPKLTIDYTTNALPVITNIETNSSLSAPKNVNENAAFTISWTDLELNPSQIFICNSSNITTSGCGDKTFCNTSLSSTNPAVCYYNINASDKRNTTFYVKVCDYANCSDTNSSNFYINHLPNITLIHPNGGEIINQSQGNYSVTFNISDADADSLIASLYYGSQQNSTTYSIASNLNLASYCIDPDSNTTTTNNCTYYWNSSGVYGSYYLTIIINDTFSSKNDSSDSSFDVFSISDNTPPNITSYSIESTTHSGKPTIITAEVEDPNLASVLASINSSSGQTNITMTNTSSTSFNTTWIAGAPGIYQYKIYATDRLGNLNNTIPWQDFNVSKPNASTQNETAPSQTLPYHVIGITGKLNATDSIRDVYAYLNVPEGFIFLQNYSQNTHLGNFSSNQTKTSTWFVAVPIIESTYTLNITYTDYYSNSWNSSSFNIQVTSGVGGYFVSVSGYPEVETSGNYSAEATFTQNGIKAAADLVTIKIYDASGILTLGPVTMDNPSTGVYTYNYTLGASVAEGQWQTIINATKSSISYYASHFWKVVGGVFDVRDIVIDNSTIQGLKISVTLENTGGVTKDLALVWNLTREDNNQNLHSGLDTIAVDAYSTKIRTIYPSTTYVGQVRITFLGYYSLTEKAGAFKIFSTTQAGTPPTPQPPPSGGGGGGVTATANLEIKFEPIVDLAKNIEKIILLQVNNTGQIELTNINLTLESLDKSYYTITPLSIASLKPGKIAEFKIKFLVTDFTGEQDFSYTVKSSQLTKREPGKMIVLSMKDYFLQQLDILRARINRLKENTTDASIINELKGCEKILDITEIDINEEKFINARSDIAEAESCIEKIEDKIKKVKEVPVLKIKMADYWAWIITWLLILILIAVLAIIIYLLYRKFKIVNFLKSETPSSQVKSIKGDYVDEKIRKIEEKLKS